jgi:hypothetical protein
LIDLVERCKNCSNRRSVAPEHMNKTHLYCDAKGFYGKLYRWSDIPKKCNKYTEGARLIVKINTPDSPER